MIDTGSWKDYTLSTLFNVQKGTGYGLAKLPEGETPLVSAKTTGNCIVTYADVPSRFPADTITVTTDGAGMGYATVQDKAFDIASNACALLPYTDIGHYAKFYVCAVIRRYASRFSYSYKMNQEQLNHLKIKLPSTSDGQPDWNYMEAYMKKVMEEAEEYIRIVGGHSYETHPVDISEWGEFRVGDLFDKLTLKCRKPDFNKAVDCSEIQTEEFSLPLTNAKHFNNGIQFYGRPDEWDSVEMTIDIVSNGAIATGDVYAQPQRTGVLWDSYLVKCKYDIKSELVLQYLACVIQRCVKQYFGWEDKCTWDKVKKQIIRLPIDVNGEPDWRYMEEYMKNQMQNAEDNLKALSGVQ